jgi:hypothetical protein
LATRACVSDDIWNAMMPTLKACADDAATIMPIAMMAVAMDLLITVFSPELSST